MAKDINKTVFDEATKLKLTIFGECFKEWLPVFNHDFYTKAIYIFDFFAGSGKDEEGNLGSPLILLENAKGENLSYCGKAKKNIQFIFNEAIKKKSIWLKANVEQFLENCKEENSCKKCVYSWEVKNDIFKDLFSHPKNIDIFNNKKYGKFVLLDQYGFSQIDENVFKQLISFPKTDFIFFISSSFISRFREHENTKKYFDTEKIDFENSKPNEIHRAVTAYFRDLIPIEKEFYLHHFSIQKERKGNYYGLIFGSNHTLGMEKFLKVCWKQDKLSGEANYNIDNNFEQGTLFYEPEKTIKKDEVSKKIREGVLSGEIRNNRDGLKFALKNGCEPKIFTEEIKKMEKEKLIIRVGALNYTSTDIHKVKLYEIKRLNHEP